MGSGGETAESKTNPNPEGRRGQEEEKEAEEEEEEHEANPAEKQNSSLCKKEMRPSSAALHCIDP